MAERRMFSMKIVDSDAFLDMPLTTQALYFHLNMRADDDGFINNPKKIMRMIGAGEDDLKLLIAKRFILWFENGVVVIKHWRMHNLLRKDRYNETQYIKQKALLIVREDGAYTEIPPDNQLATTWQPPDNQLATQDRIGKDSIGKGSIGEEREGEDTPPPSAAEIINLYHSLCSSFPVVKSVSRERIESIKTLLNTYTPEQIRKGFEMAERSGFLKGNNKRGWKASFDWLIQEANMAKVLDGNYTDSPQKAGSFDTDAFFAAALEKSYKEPPKTAADDDSIRERGEELKKLIGGDTA